jgi:hypothetical protein
MTSGDMRFRIRLGAAELDYEGSTDFLKVEIMPIVERILGMLETRAEFLDPPPAPHVDQSTRGVTSAAMPDLSHSTNTIARLLNAKSASDLVIATAAQLTLVQKKERLSRQEMLDEMKKGTSFFKSSYVNNLSNSLKILVNADRLRLLAPDTYGLSHKERTALERILAESK